VLTADLAKGAIVRRGRGGFPAGGLRRVAG
jgi:hypothetical protein